MGDSDLGIHNYTYSRTKQFKKKCNVRNNIWNNALHWFFLQHIYSSETGPNNSVMRRPVVFLLQKYHIRASHIGRNVGNILYVRT